MLDNFEMARSARQAADLILAEGWFKSATPYVPGEISRAIRFPAHPNSARCFCALTAIPVRGSTDVIQAFARFLGYKGPIRDSDLFIINWNDAQVSSSIIVAAFRDFADNMETKEIEFV